MPTNHRSIQDSDTILPQSNGDRDFTQEFTAPGLNQNTRPFLSYRVNPASDTAVRLQMELNGTEIVDNTLQSTVSRQLNEIFDHGVLVEGNNVLRVFVPNTDPGRVTVSDIILFYSAD